MDKDAKQQTRGREKNGAEPPGPASGLSSDQDVRRTGEESRRRAGPDGPDAREVGDTFKR